MAYQDDEETTVLDEVQNLAAEQADETAVQSQDEADYNNDQEDGNNPDNNEEEQPKGKKNWVEFSPEQQEKFNDLYKQVKMSDARNQLKDQMLEKAMAKIDELEKRFSQTDQAEAEKVLKSRLQEARDEGDVDKEIAIFQELAELKKGAQEKPKEQPKSNLPDDPETRYVVALAQETDDNGALIRPWLV